MHEQVIEQVSVKVHDGVNIPYGEWVSEWKQSTTKSEYHRGIRGDSESESKGLRASESERIREVSEMEWVSNSPSAAE